jgi:hypothetical protein
MASSVSFVRPEISVHADLTLVGRSFRQARRSGVSRIDAEQLAVDTYCGLHPDVPDSEARPVVAKLIKASSEAGLIWMDNAS